MILKLRSEFLLLLIISFFFTSCLTNVEETEVLDECQTTSYANTIKPILDTSCIECHNGSQFPDLTDYNKVSANAAIVKAEVESRRMPQGNTLTAEEITAIVCWVENGALDN